MLVIRNKLNRKSGFSLMSWLKKRIPSSIAFSAPLGAVIGSVISVWISPNLVWYYWLLIVIGAAALTVGMMKILGWDRFQVPYWLFVIVFAGMMLAGLLHHVLY
jgi:hypothetical protein